MAGVDFDHLLGLITASTEVTQNASKSANGFKSILVNLMSDKYEKQFNQFGLSMRDANGAMKDGFTILQELSGKYKQLGEKMDETGEFSISLNDNMNALLEDIGGKYNINVLTAALSNFDQAINATNSSLNSAGSAQDEYQVALDGITKKLDALKGQFQELVYGEGGLANFIKFIIDTGTAILKFANSDIGQTIIKVTAFVASLTLLTKGLQALKVIMMANTTSNLLFGIQALIVGAGTLTEVIGFLTTTMLANPLFAPIAIIAGISTIIIALGKLNVTLQEQIELLNESKNSYDTANKKLEDTKIKLDSIREKLELIKNGKLEISSDKDLQNLKEQEVSLSNQLIIEQERLRIEKEKMELEAKKTLEKPVSNQLLTGVVGADIIGTAPERLEELNTKISEQQNRINELISVREVLIEVNGEESAQVKEITDVIDGEIQKKNKLSEEALKYVDIVSNAIEVLGEESELYQELYPLIDDYRNSIEETKAVTEGSLDVTQELSSNLEELAESVGLSVEEFKKQAEAMGLTADQFADYITNSQEIADETDEINKSIDGLQNALSIAKKAQEEYNETGALTLDTFQSLLGIAPEYLTALINEDGQVQLNEESLYNLTEQLKQTKIEELQNAMVTDILALRNGNLAEMSETARGAVADVGSAALQAGYDALEGAKGLTSFALAMGQIVMTKNMLMNQGGGGDALLDLGALNEQEEAIRKRYEEMMKSFQSIQIDFSGGGSGGGGKKGGSGGGKGKSAEQLAKEANKAYKEGYDKKLALLKHELEMEIIEEKDYYAELNSLNEEYFGEASGHHEEFIDEYRKNQEAIYKWEKEQKKEALKDSIDLYEQALEHVRDTLDKQLDALKEERDEELEYLDKRIDRIEEKKDKELDSIKVTIDALKKEKKEFEKNIDSQIDSLEELKDKEEEEWDAKIEAFKEQNKLLEEQNELQRLQEALAKARSSKVKIFQGGKFTYGMDETAVSEAEQAIEDYYTQRKQEEELKALEDARDSALENYQKQIDDLKKYKDSMKEQYDKRIEDLESYYDQVEERYDLELEQMKEHRDQVQEEYDEQIKDMEDYIDEVEGMVDSYEKEQNRLAFIQLAGAKAENEVWMSRIDNLRNFVKEYNDLQAQLEAEENGVQNDVTGSIGSAGSGLGNILGGRASGDSSIKKDGAYIIDENPKHRELVIGSSLNKDAGVLMNLKKGDGVVNTKSTNTLAGIFNSLGSSFNSGFKPIERQSSSSNSLIIDKVYVQADNAMQFIDSMTREFKINMKQESFNPL